MAGSLKSALAEGDSFLAAFFGPDVYLILEKSHPPDQDQSSCFVVAVRQDRRASRHLGQQGGLVIAGILAKPVE
jgi:hypothetical protein